MTADILYDDEYFQVISPKLPLNCRKDGGHLILIKKEKVTDRSDMTYQEAIDFMRVSMIVGKAMYQVLGIERMNYEDLGNWGIDEPGGGNYKIRHSPNEPPFSSISFLFEKFSASVFGIAFLVLWHLLPLSRQRQHLLLPAGPGRHYQGQVRR